jgi:hypothetical protein
MIVCSTCVREKRVTGGLSDWDRRQELGFFSTLWTTLMAVTLHPIIFFEKLAPRGGLGSAALFLLLLAIPAGIVTTGVSAAYQTVAPADISQFEAIWGADSPFTKYLAWTSRPSWLKAGLNLVFFPLWVVGWASLGALFVHFGLLVVGGERHGFAATLKAVYYGHGVTFWAVIPFCGGLVAGFWAWFTVSTGVAKLHEAPGWKGAVAVLWIPVLFILLICGLLSLGFAFALYGMGTAGGF